MYNKNATSSTEREKSQSAFSFEFLKEKTNSLWEDAKYVLRAKSIEIGVGAALAGILAFAYQRQREAHRANFIPLAFSEIEQIEKNIEKQGHSIGPVNVYSLKVNDLCMKVFESYNQAHGYGIFTNKVDVFGRELHDAMTLKNIHKYNLDDLLTQLPKHIPEVKQTFAAYKDVQKSIENTIPSLEDARDDRHTDNYHTEVRTKTVSDGNGKSHTETYTVSVYDDTTHKYTYHADAGNNVGEKLGAIYHETPTLLLKERIFTTDKTNAEGEYAADKSREWLKKGALTKEELLQVANTWYTGSTILDNVRSIDQLYPLLQKGAAERNQAKKNAHDHRYKTYSHHDDGPYEFQVNENNLENAHALDANLRELLNTIETTNIKIPLLEQKIDTFLQKGYIHFSDTTPRERKKMMNEIMKLTKEIYILNFKKGIDVERFRGRLLFLVSLLAAIIGAGAGLGVDAAAEKYGWRGEKK